MRLIIEIKKIIYIYRYHRMAEEETPVHIESEAVESVPTPEVLEEAPVEKNRGRKKKEVVPTQQVADPVVATEPVAVEPADAPEPVVVVAPKAKAKRQPRTTKTSPTVVDVVPLNTSQSSPEEAVVTPTEKSEHVSVEHLEDLENNLVHSWQELQKAARAARKHETAQRYKRMLEGKIEKHLVNRYRYTSQELKTV